MIVARQFIPGTRSIKNPSRRARPDPYPQLIKRPNRGTPIGPDHTVPYGTDPFLGIFQAINCLATIICPYYGTPIRPSLQMRPLERSDVPGVDGVPMAV
jgi:hypothetical protein